MREARIAVGRLGDMTRVTTYGTTILTGLAHGASDVLHPEKMRRDKTVPSDVREYSRFDGFDVP